MNEPERQRGRETGRQREEVRPGRKREVIDIGAAREPLGKDINWAVSNVNVPYIHHRFNNVENLSEHFASENVFPSECNESTYLISR